MDLTLLTDWARTDPWTAALAFGPSAAVLLLLAAGAGRALTRRLRGRLTVPVAVPALGALLATGLSADTAWRFAAERLGISELWERGLIFAVGEVTLFSFALGARTNLHQKGRTGLDGIMVWATCAALAVPAWSVSDSFAAAVGRLLFGPTAAAVLWHKAMGIELRHVRPTAQDEGLLATIGRDLRERFLARFGLAIRDRTAQQLAQERAADKAALLSERFHAQNPKYVRRRALTLRRLRRAQRKAGVTTDKRQRDRVLEIRAHLQHAAGPRELPSPWPSKVPTARTEQQHRTLPATEHPAPNTGGWPAPNSSEHPLPQPTEHPAPNTFTHPRPQTFTEHRTDGGEQQHSRAEQPSDRDTERPGGRLEQTRPNTPVGVVPPQVSAPNTQTEAPTDEPANTPFDNAQNAASPPRLPPEMTDLFGAWGRQRHSPGEHPHTLPLRPAPNTLEDDTEQAPNTGGGNEPEPPNTDAENTGQGANGGNGEQDSGDELTTREKIVRERANGAGVRETARRLDCSVGYVSDVFRELKKEEEEQRAQEREAATTG
ncbi:hypothetical protein ABZ569_32385 [Streptomyces albus]|uniref:hypothetical protein n=1 Tax=Streptomyces albus TaxID=1888 RepID=UPI0033C0786E